MRAATFGVPRVSVWRCDAAADRPSALSRLGHEPDSKLGAHGLGTKLNHRGRRVLSYEPARKFVWHLCLRSEEDFRDWATNSRRGAVFIPRDPDVAYAGKGWVDWEDFLGTPVDFETCRAYARSLNLTSQHEWWELARREGGLPHRIPTRPGQYFRDKGWQGFPDFLGIPEREDEVDLGYR